MGSTITAKTNVFPLKLASIRKYYTVIIKHTLKEIFNGMRNKVFFFLKKITRYIALEFVQKHTSTHIQRNKIT